MQGGPGLHHYVKIIENLRLNILADIRIFLQCILHGNKINSHTSLVHTHRRLFDVGLRKLNAARRFLIKIFVILRGNSRTDVTPIKMKMQRTDRQREISLAAERYTAVLPPGD